MRDKYGGTFWTEEYASMPVDECNIREFWGKGKTHSSVQFVKKKILAEKVASSGGAVRFANYQ